MSLSNNSLFSESPIKVPEAEVVFMNYYRKIRKLSLPSGHTHYYNDTKATAAVLAIQVIDNITKVLVVKQPRYAFEKETIEIPKGQIEKDESPEEAAFRELKEETGYVASSMKKLLLRRISSPGLSNEVVHCFLTTELTAGKPSPDLNENIISGWIPLNQLILGFEDGSYEDLVTDLAISKYLLRYSSR